MKKLVTISVFAVFLMGAYIPTDAERARWTMFDMRSWKTAFEAYKLDHSEYPHLTTLDQARAAVEPIYMKRAPMTDAWGNPYRVESDGKSFRFISAGADGVFQTDTSAGGVLQSFNDDAVVTESGKWLFRYWEMK